jgi:hypothetical protein
MNMANPLIGTTEKSSGTNNFVENPGGSKTPSKGRNFVESQSNPNRPNHPPNPQQAARTLLPTDDVTPGRSGPAGGGGTGSVGVPQKPFKLGG